MLFISLCVVGCAMMYAQQMPGLLQKGKADIQDCKAWVDEQLSEMSLKEKIGPVSYTHLDVYKRQAVLLLV